MGMRIALVSREFPPGHGGGIGSYAARIAPALANAGARVHIITRLLAPSETEIQPPPGVTIHRVEMGDRSGESCLRASIVTARKILDLIRTDGLDAIEFPEYEAMASAWLALRSLDQAAARIPVAVHLHSPTELNAQLNGHDPRSLDRAMQDLIAAERRTIALADGVCAPGSFMADWARECFAMPERATVIPYAADLADPPAPKPDDRTLLYVGRLEQRKGVDTLIRAWNRVAPDHPGWSLRLVGADTNTAPGGGSCRAWLESMLDPALLARTDFAGPMNAAQLREVRARTALAVIPSRWENFPNTCIEAMAAGLPIIASDHGGMAEMLGLPAISGAADGPCGCVFPAGDDEALARALDHWMSVGPEARIGAGLGARDRISELCDPQRVSEQRLRWFRSLRSEATGTDPALAALLHIDEIAAASTLDAALARILDRFDHATGAATRVSDPAQWIERVRAALANLADRGIAPVALYGAGHFTRSIGPALEDSPVEVACIIDDNPESQGRTLHALPIVSQAEAMRRGVRAVVLCANQWEDTLWSVSLPMCQTGIEVVRLFSKRPPRVMVVESGVETRHFAGVVAELERRGVEVLGDAPHAVYPVPDDDLDLVCVADVLAPRNIAIARTARAKGIRTLLLMDGVVEWRNTFINPLAGPNFLRPAPVDFICCATTDDERHLTELGNKAKATGLPRLDDLQPIAPDPAGPVLVATANTPWFNDRERSVLIDALRELKQVATDRGIPIRWRLTGGLDRLLGLENHPGTITEAMSGCRAVISTPSTLLLEASLLGLPVAVLDPFAQPVLEGMSGVVRSANAPELLDALGARPEWAARAYPPSRTGSTAASLLADRIAEIARTPGRTEASAPFLPTVTLPNDLPKSDRRRVVSAIVCDGSPTSGVTTFSLRMSAESAHRDSGWEWHTLLIQTQPKNAANDGLRELEPEKLGHVHVCTLDPTADHHETLKACRAAIERLHPDVLAPNFSDMAWAIAAQLRFTGVRTLGIMHSDDEAYRTTLRERPIWDAGIGVSAACTEQIRKIGAEVFEDPPPIEQITYGVPVAKVVPQRATVGPIRLLYVGRLVEHQKRVSRLIELAAHLRDLGCSFTLDLIGDGPSEQSLRRAMESEGLSEMLRLRGRLTPEEVQAELDRADGLVLVSDFEGTSIAMLEAMGRGVLPCVSEVASGVSEWVRDGENGVSAPVGDVRGLAAKIAGVGEDRHRLRRMQHAAWETVCERGSIGVMFDRYQRVLDACMARALRTEPSDLGLYLTEGGRWLKTWSDDPADAKRYARRVLEEAGFRNIASDEPEDSSDAVILDTSRSLEPTQHLEEWRARGLGVACVPLIIDRPGWVRLDAAVRFAMRNGAERVALYGAGQHTQRALPMLVRHLPIVGVIDDRPQVDFLAGIPVVRPDEAIDRLRCEAVVLSSDTIEGTLWRASRALREQGIAVYPLYADYSEEPIAAATA